MKNADGSKGAELPAVASGDGIEVPNVILPQFPLAY